MDQIFDGPWRDSNQKYLEKTLVKACMIFFSLFVLGGVEDIDQLPVPQFRKGFVGCISELSVGKLFSVDLLNRAKNGQNVDSCRETFDF